MAGFGSQTNPIQVLGPKAAAAVVTASGTAQDMTMAGTGKVYRLISTTDIHWDNWQTAAAATAEKLPADTPVFFVDNGRTACSVIWSSAAGVVYLQEWGLV